MPVQGCTIYKFQVKLKHGRSRNLFISQYVRNIVMNMPELMSEKVERLRDFDEDYPIGTLWIEAPEYKGRIVRTVHLGKHVLVVAVQGKALFDWTAYIGSTHGLLPREHIWQVGQHGDKLPKSVGELLFPIMAERYQWRY